MTPDPASPALPEGEVKPWTEQDDRFLIFYGRCLAQGFAQDDGYEFVGMHDLHREEGEATARIAWLREHRPLLVKQLETEADLEPE